MPDDPNKTSATTSPGSSNEPLGNDPSVRNPDGTIKDPAATTTSTAASETSKTSTQTPAPETKPEGAPEKYADFKAPEGFEIDPKAIESVVPIFKDLGLNQDQAQRLIDFYAEQSRQAAEAPMAAYRDLRQQWRQDVVKSDLGNGTDNLKPEVQAAVSAAIDSLPNAAKFREILDLSGVGDNPEFIRGWYELAQRAGEGKAVKGSGPSPLGQRAPGSGPRTAAQAIYPNLPSAS